jgi:hypothetical protein
MEEKSILQPYLVHKIMVAITVILFIAAIHIFRVGTYFSGKLFILYYSFFSDIVIPIGIYFMLCINDVSIPILKNWKTKAAIVFIIAAGTEIAQAFGIPILGSTFDPLDFVMFGVGIFIAIGLDYIFSRVFSFWSFGDEKVPTGM